MSSIDKAYDLYLKHIYDREKIALLSNLNLKVSGSVPSVMWEAFGAVLTERSGSGLTGADLLGWEVKSAKFGGNFEYQYHLNTGLAKLQEDCEVNHLFCSYSPEYDSVIVRAMRGQDLAGRFFKAWEPGYSENYYSEDASRRRQRYRKNISYSFVREFGVLVLEIAGGRIIYRDDTVIPDLNAEG